MTVLFVADGSSSIGLGHVMRCLSLLVALKKQGHQCLWALKRTDPRILDRVSKAADRVLILEPTLSHDDVWTHVLSYAQTQCVDFVVSDHYETMHQHFKRILSLGLRLLIIDDIADREYSCTLLLNPNSSDVKLYQGRLVGVDRLLLGTEFILLRPEFASTQKSLKVASDVGRVLITMGGSDRYNMTYLALQALACEGAWAIDVVLGPGYQHTHSLVTLQQRTTCELTLYHAVDSLLPHMVVADLMICSAGSTVWEGCCVGVPMVVIQTVANQDQVVLQVQKTGAVQFMGHRKEVDVMKLRQACFTLMKDIAGRQALSDSGRQLVDGLGTVRVVNEMERYC